MENIEHVDINTYEARGGLFDCLECDATCGTQSGIKRHFESIHLGKRYFCNYKGCPTGLVGKKDLRNHELKHAENGDEENKEPRPEPIALFPCLLQACKKMFYTEAAQQRDQTFHENWEDVSSDDEEKIENVERKADIKWNDMANMFDARVGRADTEGHRIVLPGIKSRDIRFHGERLRLETVFHMLQTRKELYMEKGSQWANWCGVHRCVSHSFPRQIGVNLVEEFDWGTWMYALHYLQRHSRPATATELQKNIKPLQMPCRIWTLTISKQHAYLSFGGRHMFASALSWGLFNGETIEKPFRALHKCKNFACIEPSHIEPGTHQQNMQDKRRDGTQTYGETHHLATITAETAVAIAKSYGDGTQAERAAKLKGTAAIVGSIDSGKTWQDIIPQFLRRKPRKRSSKVLSPDDVRTIRKAVKDGSSYQVAGKLVGVPKHTVNGIVNGKNYKHVPEDPKDDDKIQEEKKARKLDVKRKAFLQSAKMDDAGCLIWQQATAIADNESKAYGIASLRSKSNYAHIISWILFKNGGVDSGRAGMQVRHLCNVTLCVNPEHLQLGTKAENEADKITHGTLPRGSAHYKATITEEVVKEIKRAQAKGESTKEVAKRSNVKRQIVDKIYKELTWKHVSV